MGVATTLSIIGVVVAFLIKALVVFGAPDDTYNPPGVNDTAVESYSVEAVHQASGMFSNRYMQLIDEIVSFQKDPDYERAEARRQELVDAGTALVGMFQDFEDRLQAEFAAPLLQAEEASAGATE